MERLIDADALLHELATSSYPQDVDINRAYRIFQNELAAAPTVDAVPVVRCKNCIHWGKFPVSTVFPQYHKCGMATYKSTMGDDFCSDGKDDDNG